MRFAPPLNAAYRSTPDIDDLPSGSETAGRPAVKSCGLGHMRQMRPARGICSRPWVNRLSREQPRSVAWATILNYVINSQLVLVKVSPEAEHDNSCRTHSILRSVERVRTLSDEKIVHFNLRNLRLSARRPPPTHRPAPKLAPHRRQYVLERVLRRESIASREAGFPTPGFRCIPIEPLSATFDPWEAPARLVKDVEDSEF